MPSFLRPLLDVLPPFAVFFFAPPRPHWQGHKGSSFRISFPSFSFTESPHLLGTKCIICPGLLSFFVYSVHVTRAPFVLELVFLWVCKYPFTLPFVLTPSTFAESFSSLPFSTGHLPSHPLLPMKSVGLARFHRSAIYKSMVIVKLACGSCSCRAINFFFIFFYGSSRYPP